MVASCTEAASLGHGYSALSTEQSPRNNPWAVSEYSHKSPQRRQEAGRALLVVANSRGGAVGRFAFRKGKGCKNEFEAHFSHRKLLFAASPGFRGSED